MLCDSNGPFPGPALRNSMRVLHKAGSPVASLMKLVPPYSRQQMLIILDEASVDQARLGAFRRRSL